MSTSSTKSKAKLIKSVKETDWGFVDADTKQLTHEIHRYSGKYIPQIARKAIELITEPGEKILDPYVGSGTTLLEANLSLRNSIGVDLNPLAVLIAKVKTTPVQEKKLEDLLKYFNNLIVRLANSKKGQRSLLDDANDNILDFKDDRRFTDPWYTKWFSRPVLEDLIILDIYISRYKEKDCADIAKIAFSNILRRCSNAHNGYPNVMLDKNKINFTNPLPIFIKSLEEVVKKVKKLNTQFQRDAQIKVVHGNAKKLDLDNSSIDAVVTHPPYIGSVPYAEYGTLSLKWLGFEPKELDKELTGGKRQSKDVVDRFLVDYRQMLAESYRVLKANKYLFILIGDPTVKGQVIDLAEMTKDLAQEVGFKLVIEKERNGINRRANKMGPETLLFLQKA